jgi:hypothetical protein
MQSASISNISRRRFIQLAPAAAGATAIGGLPPTLVADQADRLSRHRVRDRFWAWAHEAGVYNGAWGLPGNSRITPVEGAHYLGVPNVIFIRYEGRPAPSFEQYAVPFASLSQVNWSITGAGGATSDDERRRVLRLAASMPNLTGVFMDDFFQFDVTDRPQWLAENHPAFPVSLTITLPRPVEMTRLELTQSDWRSGDYRSREFIVEASVDGMGWNEVGRGAFPDVAAAKARLTLPSTTAKRLRDRIPSTHDTVDAMSCGLCRIRLWAGEREIPLTDAQAEASSTYPNHPARNVLSDPPPAPASAPASLSVQQLREVRKQLNVAGRRLDLGVTLYTYQLVPQIVPHLDLCDVISLWTWRARDLKDLEGNFARLKALMPSKRIRLGCYMWDFGDLKLMPLDRMKMQCELGLRWLRQGQIEGMIFLATNICDLKLETVEWTRRWIAEVGDEPL